MITITHITMTGQNVPDATVHFGPNLTLVRGPSDTGKSFIVDAIDFALGGSSLKDVPEREGYDRVQLGVRAGSGEVFTLVRATSGGRIGVYEELLSERTVAPPDFTLASKHSATSEDNLSRFLLGEIGLDDRRIRKNARNETDSLSFRNLAHLTVVDETQMQSEISPVLTGSYTTGTKEVSAFKLMLSGEDDSALQPILSTTERTRTRAAKAEVIESLIASLELRLDTTADRPELLDQLARLNTSIDTHSGALSAVVHKQSEAAQKVSEAQGSQISLRRRFVEVNALRSRLALLETQYASDLARLEMISEAGDLLGFFGTGVCTYCGSPLSGEHAREQHSEGADAAESISAEIEKTRSLRVDLSATLNDLDTEIETIREEHAAGKAALGKLESELAGVDEELQPSKTTLQELTKAKATVEKGLALYEQLEELRQALTAVMADNAKEVAIAAGSISYTLLDAFSREMSDLLEKWGFPDSASVRYDRADQDVIAGGQARAAHGKGVRAILHAAFTVALGQYCVNNGLPHPGFVVIDSPLVTYRPPDELDPTSEQADSMPSDLASRFYDSLQSSVGVQVIVMENTDPPEGVPVGATDVVFTKSVFGRYGYFPLSSPPKALTSGPS
ncbi:AAA family ATPase [Microbacterium sp. RURRCA19A]|uniref:AAA family ATPase n=1 Tax=Microbacterium sp. RURRCA19A TaxID=1907391 RepID=UPI0009557EC9|nr:AAA family ATPase [Microbacterium sp. RURRCA19A]SIR94928.1 AAA domain-containing protein [Microbacterium sp. RURRCA19A]